MRKMKLKWDEEREGSVRVMYWNRIASVVKLHRCKVLIENINALYKFDSKHVDSESETAVLGMKLWSGMAGRNVVRLDGKIVTYNCGV